MTRTLKDWPRRCIASAIVLALAAALCTGCGKTSSGGEKDSQKTKASKEEEKTPEVVVPVEAAFPEIGSISSYFETTARIAAERRVDVVSEGIGECISVNVEEGDTVEKGQSLAELDKEEALAALRQLEIQVAQNRTSYEIAEKSLAEGLGAKVERDNARFAYEQAAASLAAQQLKVDNLTIRAPIGGVVTRRNIQAGQMVTTGAPAFSVVDPESFTVEINPPEKELSRLKDGQPALVSVDALGGKEFPATVRRINPAVDPATGTIKVVLDFDQDTRASLRESAFVRVRLVMDTHADVLVVAKDVIVEENGRKYAFLVEEKEEEKKEEEASKESDKEDASAEAAGDKGASDKDNAGVKDAEAGEEGKGEAAEESGKAKSEEDEKKDIPAEKKDADAKGDEATTEKKDGEGATEEKDGAADDAPPKKILVATRVEVQTGFEDSLRVEIVSGLQEDSLVVTLGQHMLRPGAHLKVTNAKTLIDETSKLSAEEALKAAKEARAKGAKIVSSGSHHH